MASNMEEYRIQIKQVVEPYQFVDVGFYKTELEAKLDWEEKKRYDRPGNFRLLGITVLEELKTPIKPKGSGHRRQARKVFDVFHNLGFLKGMDHNRMYALVDLLEIELGYLYKEE